MKTTPIMIDNIQVNPDENARLKPTTAIHGQ
jgi:hypothetical protein